MLEHRRTDSSPVPAAKVAHDAGQLTLDDAPLRQAMWVVAVTSPVGAPDWAARLEEIGFWPGERVTVLAHGQPGQDPLMVRVGDSTFALRRAEAACVIVRVAQAPSGEHHA